MSIVGGGLAGPLMALFLAKRNIHTEVFESRNDPRDGNAPQGRSINLAMSTRGFSALKEVGLEVEEMAIPMYGRLIHNIDGSLHYQAYGKDKEAIYSISRLELNKLLLDQLDRAQVKTHFGVRCLDYTPQENTLTFQDQKGQILKIQSQLVIGADGYMSVIRDKIGQLQDINLKRYDESHGYKELNISPEFGSSLSLNALHIWPRGKFMLIALPNLSGNWTCTLFIDIEQLKTMDVTSFFTEYFPDVLPLIPDIEEQFNKNPIGKLCTVKCDNWAFEDKAILIGDAAHTLVPFYGQGMNCAFEDCSVFNKIYDPTRQRESLQEFYQSRKQNTDAIQDMAVENFIEMRDLVADEFFQRKKKSEALIGLQYPEYVSKYGMVSFSNIPYSVAKKHGTIIDSILNEQCKQEPFNVEQTYQLILNACKRQN